MNAHAKIQKSMQKYEENVKYSSFTIHISQLFSIFVIQMYQILTINLINRFYYEF